MEHSIQSRMNSKQNPTNHSLLRHLPAVDQVLRHPSLADCLHHWSGEQASQRVRSVVETVRQRILDGELIEPDQIETEVLRLVRLESVASEGESVRRVINATGVLLHTNLGRAPLAPSVAKRVMESTGYCNVELNLQSGRRSKRGASVAKSIAQLVGAEDAVVVNNCAAATILVLHALAAGREVIVSRGQLVEIGGGFRLPEVFTTAGVRLREIGTTNRTYLTDYENAIGEQTGAIIRVHRGNFVQTGFVTQPTIDELVRSNHADSIPVIDDIGSGWLSSAVLMDSLGATARNEPDVKSSVACGADVTLFSGDKLFGGPQCGIIVGKTSWIERIKQSPMVRAMRIDKMTLAALQATVEIHVAGKAEEELPFLRMIRRTPSDIKADCEKVMEAINSHQRRKSEWNVVDLAKDPAASGSSARSTNNEFKATIVECSSQIGGGSMPGATLQSYAVAIEMPQLDRFAARLRQFTPAIQTRVTESQLLLDLRTVQEGEVALLIRSLNFAIEELLPERE